MQRRRPAFTIVELLVSMALIMFIMAILSEAFIAGLETFRNMKAIGDMDEKLRAAATLIRKDLRMYHIDRAYYLSDVSAVPFPLNNPAVTAPHGFFFIRQDTPYLTDGGDANDIRVLRNANKGVYLHFSVNAAAYPDPRIDVMRRENWLVGDCFAPEILDLNPPAFQRKNTANQHLDNVCFGRMAEVIYYLRPLEAAPGVPATTTASNVPLYNLCRRQAVLIKSGYEDQMALVSKNAMHDPNNPMCYVNWSKKLYGVSIHPQDPGANPAYLMFNKPADLCFPERRSLYKIVSGAYDAPTSPYDFNFRSCPLLTMGGEILLSNVVSFTVRGMFDSTSGAFTVINPTFAGTYDTATTIIRPLAVEIILRVWDPKTRLTRQVTIIENL
jgi:type II secretory pathway pseudopilin PulG